jgi:L-fuconolactonase
MKTKRLEGRDEPILQPELPIVDAHHHLFDRPQFRYMFEDLQQDLGLGHDVRATVYIETQAMARSTGPEWLRPTGEVEFANGVAAMSASANYGPAQVCAGIIGYADLRLGGEVAATLERNLAISPDRFRGIRQNTIAHPSEVPYRYMSHPPARDILQTPAFRVGFAELGKRALSFDAVVFHNQLPELGSLAAAFPGTQIVLNHLGLAMAMGMGNPEKKAVFEEWRTALRQLARHENVACKVGGLGMPFWGFGFHEREDPIGFLELAAAWRPYVEVALEAFGVGRCMMEGNFPQDGWSCGYVPLWNALKHITRDCSRDEQHALFSRTAQRVYRIALESA